MLKVGISSFTAEESVNDRFSHPMANCSSNNNGRGSNRESQKESWAWKKGPARPSSMLKPYHYPSMQGHLAEWVPDHYTGSTLRQCVIVEVDAMVTL